ncbi:MAG: T9SS type A sorting domain-containing protein [candidate division Zixibacteria bacterium]|nr:T9SS type A sorting domain-containing protein [candidate division Zixibacteria bacterium]
MQRILFIIVLGGILCLGSLAFGQNRSECGDVNGSSEINIADVTYLLSYLFHDGPPPPDPSAADVDLCDSIDMNDVGYFINYLFSGGPALCSGGADCNHYSGGQVTLDHVDGTLDATSILVGEPVNFYLRFTNNIGTRLSTLANGFRIYSPDGATWDDIAIDTVTNPYSVGYAVTIWTQYISANGSVADTVAAGAQVFMADTGLTSGQSEVFWKISLPAFDAGDVGKTICLDSSFRAPGVVWKWSTDGLDAYIPSWDGPHCYTIVETPETSITLDNVINASEGMDSIKTNRLVTFELRFQNNSIYLCDGFTNGFKVYSPDGATWTTTVGDSTGVLNSTNWDLVHVINYFGVTGSNTDTVGFGGVSFGSTGMPAGFNDIPYTITIGPINDADAGKTICLDSTFFPPGGLWKWSMTVSPLLEPYWDGPHCFEIYIPTEPPFELAATPDTLEFFGYQGHPDPPSQSFYVEEATVGEAIEFQCDWIESFVNIASPNGVTPQSMQVDVAISGLSLGDHYSDIEVWSIDAFNTETVVVKLTVEEAPLVADSVIVPTMTATYGSMVQPIVTKLTQEIRGATIPLKIPSTVVIDSLTTTGLLTEDWEFAQSHIDPDAGWLFMGFANTHGAVIPIGETEVFHIHFHPTWADCNETTFITWDTALSDDPVRVLLFADLDNMDLQVGFDRERDTTYIPPYTPGDIKADGDVNIDDLIYLVGFMFDWGPPPPIIDAADVNGNCTGPNIADLTYLVYYMFQSGQAPQCGCIQGSTAKIAPNQDIILNSNFQHGVTTITINSTIRLRGLQLELETNAGIVPVNLVDENWDLVYGYSGNTLRLGMLDLKGVHDLSAGRTAVVELAGECQVISALVSDENHQEWQPVIRAKGSTTPNGFVLHQNYPNPFNPTTEIQFSLSVASDVKLEIYNVMGQKVSTIVNENLEAGDYTFEWDGSKFSSGVYFYRVETDNIIESKKMVLLK